MTESIETIKTEALAAVAAADSPEALDTVRLKYISRKGLIPGLMQHLKSLPPEEKKAFGQQVNDLKNTFQEALDNRRAAVEQTMRFRIRTPLIHLSKKEIISKGMSLGVEYAEPHSCYDPSPGGLACGQCDSCRLRKKGFSEAGVADPTPYVRE